VIGIVVSRADEASVHVGRQLLAAAEWTERRDDERPDADGGGTYYATEDFELREFDALHLELEGVAATFDDPDLVVFVSRHAGETGPLLTAHFTGNVGPAEYGGRPNELARACPNAHARVLAALYEHVPEDYEVGMECTHHGPSRVGAPSMFVEVGSSEPQWRDEAAATAVARAVLDLAGAAPDRERALVGFGGGHYAPRFDRIVRETDWAVGHVLADWAIEAVGEVPDAVVEQAFEGSAATLAVVDGEYPALESTVERLGYRVVGESWVRATSGVPLDLVERVEGALCAVDDGLRFGDAARDAGGRDAVGTDVTPEAVGPDLVEAALAVDPNATRRAFERGVLAFETTEGGTRPTGRVLVADDSAFEAVVESLVGVLREGGATVEREGNNVVVRESVFDPEAARRQGVPEGPAFGRLAAGEAVEVEGQTVRPESVHATRTRRFGIRRDRS